MASERLNFAKFCPICGRSSVKVFVRPNGHHLYRCEYGHFSLFDTVRGQVVAERTDQADDAAMKVYASAGSNSQYHATGRHTIFLQ